MPMIDAPARLAFLEGLSERASSLAEWVTWVAEHINADHSCLYIWHEELGHFQLMAAHGQALPWVGRITVKVGEGLVGHTVVCEKPLNLTRPETHPEYRGLQGASLVPALHYCAVPVLHQGVVVAVLTVERMAGEPFGSTQEATMVTLAAQLSVPLLAWVARFGFDRRHPKGDRIGVDTQLFGAAASDGVAMGTAVVAYALDLMAVPDRRAHDIAKELSDFQRALQAAQADIKNLASSVRDRLPASELALFDVYGKILTSTDLINEIRERIQEGQWAPGALRAVFCQHAATFAAMEDHYLRERATDIRDLGERILRHILAISAREVHYPEQTVLVAEELTASMLFAVPASSLVGIVSVRGAPSSHVAILARSLGIPAVLGAADLPLAAIEDSEVIVDGYFGQVVLSPSAATHQQFMRYMEEEAEINAQVAELTDMAAETIDGHGIDLMANAGLASDLGRCMAVGADGIGLYRTEIPFMQRDRFPSEEEQYDLYRNVLQAFSPRPVVMRTLDVGGDKMLPYFPIKEDNPFLGWRGIRVALDHPEIFLLQLRAMLRASVGLDNLRIMLPMITHASELEAAVGFVQQAYDQVVQQYPDLKQPKLGAMLEVPAAIYQMPALARHIDFFSVGSNDLTQYFLAVDRNNAQVAALYDGLHPSVLQLLRQAVDSAHAQGKKIGLCGELASDPVAVVLLLAMSFDQLSVAAIALPKIKWVIRSLCMEKIREVLEEVVVMEDAIEVRSHVEQIMEDAGLGGLLRAGQ